MTVINRYLLKKIIPQSQNKFNIVLIIIFAIITLLGVLNHAMWRDEINGWLIARDSVSVLEFIRNIQYEGHPILWYLCLWILNQLTSNPIAMQIFHWFIAVWCFSLFILFSPFSKQQKILFVFGYLPFYEYSLISRNYSIGIFCVFLFCTCFSIRHKNYIPLAIILGIMANTNAYCLLLSMALALTLGFEYIFQSYLVYETKANINNIILAVIIFSLGILLSVLMLIPPQDSTLQGGASQWFLEFDWNRLNQTITRIWRSYILILIPSDSKPFDLVLFAILSLGLFGFSITMLIRKPVALFFYVIGSLEFLLFTYLKFLGSQRHYGHLYIILITSLWLSSYYKSSNLLIKYINQLPHQIKQIWLKWFEFVHRHKTTFIMIILWLQLIAGMVAFGRDLLTPYSASRDTANFIKENHLLTNIIVGSEDFTVSPISGYLNQKIYYPENQKLGSYVLFSENRKIVEDAEILSQISQLITSEKPNALLILNRELQNKKDDLNITFVAKFRKAFIYNEKYYLYQLSKKSNL